MVADATTKILFETAASQKFDVKEGAADAARNHVERKIEGAICDTHACALCQFASNF
jgi:hypothetical protein